VSVYDELMRQGNADIGVVLEYGRTGILPVTRTAGVSPAVALTGQTAGETPVPLDRIFVSFDDHKPVAKTRRHLPHWEQENGTYFITFRQADALPQEIVQQWRDELRLWMVDHPKPWDGDTADEYYRRFQERTEKWLDQGSGSCVLAKPEAAKIVCDALHHFDGDRYVLDGYVIMPNHVHVLVKPADGHSLSDVLHSWKSFTSKEIKKLVGNVDEAFWQDENFDHLVRHGSSLERKRNYVRSNPVVAKLTQGFVVGAGIGVVVRERGVTDMVEGGAVGGDTAGKMPAVLATGGTPVLHAIGAGNFARTMLLPHVKDRIKLGTIVNATGLSAWHVKEKFGFANAETEAAKVFTGRTGVTPVIQDGGHLARPNEAVMIGTRHHLHAPLVLSGLRANQHVFVEKPLCLSREELAQIDGAMQSTQGSVMVGFNRRFAPATVELKKLLTKTPGPKSLAYHVFAGPLVPDHWYANLEESGGRVLGEACHMLDFACFVLNAKPVSVTAQTVWPAQGRNAFPDSVTAQVEFSDGSSFQLIYSAEGDFAFPKETFRVFGSGLVAECENFMKLSIFQKRKEMVKKFSSKGHAEEMAAWLAFLKGEAKHPMPYAQSRQSMVLTFAVLEAIRERRSIGLAEY
jgi:predicted dehydrogenase/REP element-mobilizing transposase RayT